MRRGFTLIELLIVISIIVILAALMLPLINWMRKAKVADPNHIDLKGKTEAAPARFSVEYAGTFDAAGPDRASRRTIYVITDKTTGLVYMAVEGCGTAQLVRVDDGKNHSHLEEQ